MQKQQQKPQKEFNALLCQLNPFHKNSKNTIDRCQRSLKKYTQKSGIDIVMFPQMSFIGYNFQNEQDALPYGNFQMEGDQFQFAIDLAKKLKAYVGFGYIQKAKGFKKTKKKKQEQKEKENTQQQQQMKEQIKEQKQIQNDKAKEQTIILYNSVAIIDRTGKLHCNYRKSHLYYNDQLWAEQGDGFISIELKNRKGQSFKCVPCICMDINPKNFTSGQYQIADYIVKNDIQILLMFTNWVDSQNLNIQSSDVKATYNYWLHRLSPIFRTAKQRLLLFCDRCGYQDDVFAKKKIQFYGSSCAIMVNPIYMIKNLDINNQGYLLIQTKLPK